MKNLFLTLLLLGCQDISSESVVSLTTADTGVCTGFFVESGDIQTSSHCVDEIGEVVTVRYKDDAGVTDTTVGVVTALDTNAAGESLSDGKALIDVDLDGPWVPWCEAHAGYRVIIWGWVEEEPQREDAFVFAHWGNKYTLTDQGTGGWSGGPVVWDGCIIGTYHGRTDINAGYVKLDQ